MLNWLIEASLKNRLLVCVLAAALVVVGGRSLSLLPIDAFPDTTPVQVQINTSVPALSPQEAEQQVTIPVELASQRAARADQREVDLEVWAVAGGGDV